MEPHPAPTLLRSHILLLVLEWMDLKSISALMRTNKAVCSFIRHFERSIATSIAKSFLRGAGRPGVILDTAVRSPRAVIRSPSFAAIREFEVRNRRMDALVTSGFLDADIPDRLNLTLPQLEELRYRFKLALYATNELGDLGLRVVESLPNVAVAYADGDEKRHFEHSQVRAAQVLYIQGMSTLDLVSLAYLLRAAETGFVRYRSRGTPLFRVPVDLASLSVAFKEATLRRGSFVLYAFVRGGGLEHQAAESGLLLACTEMRMWETGGTGAHDGLHMTLMREIGRRLVGNDRKRPDYAAMRNREMAKVMNEAVGIRVHAQRASKQI